MAHVPAFSPSLPGRWVSEQCEQRQQRAAKICEAGGSLRLASTAVLAIMLQHMSEA